MVGLWVDGADWSIVKVVNPVRISIALLILSSGAVGPTGSALAAPTTVLDRSDKSAVIDWTRGMIIAAGAAAADLRAPSPRVARVKATREARTSAHERLMRRARALQLGARSVGAHADADGTVRTRLETAVDRALQLSIDYASDGSVVMTAGLPLEAVRVAVSGASTRAVQARSEATAVIVDARSVLARPRLGLPVTTPAGAYTGPTVYHRTLEAALADKRAGNRVIAVLAGPSDAGAQPENGSLTIDTSAAAYIHETSTGRKRAAQPKAARPGRAHAALHGGALLIVVLGPGT